MSESTRLIKRYYHSIKSINLRTLVDQVDNISVLLADLFDADSSAAYYKKEGNEHLIPVVYHNNGTLISPNVQMIHKEYCAHKEGAEQLVAGLLCLSEVEVKDNSKYLFAK